MVNMVDRGGSEWLQWHFQDENPSIILLSSASWHCVGGHVGTILGRVHEDRWGEENPSMTKTAQCIMYHRLSILILSRQHQQQD